MIGQSPAKRLQNSLVLSSVVGIFTVGVIVAVASIVPLYEYLKKEEERNLVLAMNAKTMAVEEYLARAKDVASQIASRTVARQILEQYNQGRISRAKLAEITGEILLDAVHYSEEVWGITRLDKKGETVVQVGLELPEAAWPVPEVTSKHTGFYGPFPMGNRSFLVIRAPIMDRQSVLVGTDLILFRLFHLQRIIEDYTGLGKTGETVLGVINDGRIDLVFPLRGSKDEVPGSIPKESTLGQALQKAAMKQSGFLRHETSADDKDVVAFGPVRNSDWCIAVKMDQDELYAPVKQQIFSTSSIIVVLILLGTLGMVLLVRPLAGKMIVRTDELERQVKEKTASLKQELSERKKMVRWLKDSERRYRTLLEEVPDVIFLLDKEGHFTYVNTQVEKFIHYPVEKILETPLQDHVVPEDRALVETMFTMSPDAIWDEEVGMIDASGAEKFARIRSKAILSEETGPIRYEGVMRDITRRKSLEEEVKASREQLIEKIKIIDDLYEHIVQTGKSKAIADHTAEVAHELRQPLAIIGGFARRLARQFDSCEITDTGGQRESCRIIIDEIKRLEKILDTLIDFTRHERIHLKRVDPNDIIENVLRVNQGRIGEKNLRVEVNLEKHVGDVSLDPERFEQVVRNLVSNAIEASPNGEVITVSTGFFIPSEKASETGGLESESYFEMKIGNQGREIPPDELQKIFSPFYTTKNYGTGIGLTLAKKIVEEHDGSISVKSDEEGTMFTLWLPLHHERFSALVGVVPSGS
ncbi:MAG: PAS domain S-box protein [Desulfomonile tiedjei]|nr:PAS domain S-box protein [Desulfomonile tiedjei]